MTVIAENPIDADILATALYVMGPEEGLAWAAAERNVAALFVRDSNRGPELSWTEPMLDHGLVATEHPTSRSRTTGDSR